VEGEHAGEVVVLVCNIFILKSLNSLNQLRVCKFMEKVRKEIKGEKEKKKAAVPFGLLDSLLSKERLFLTRVHPELVPEHFGLRLVVHVHRGEDDAAAVVRGGVREEREGRVGGRGGHLVCMKIGTEKCGVSRATD
jgi:hypothetical protein